MTCWLAVSVQTRSDRATVSPVLVQYSFESSQWLSRHHLSTLLVDCCTSLYTTGKDKNVNQDWSFTSPTCLSPMNFVAISWFSSCLLPSTLPIHFSCFLSYSNAQSCFLRPRYKRTINWLINKHPTEHRMFINQSRLEAPSGQPKQPMDWPGPQGQQQHTTSWFVEAMHRARSFGGDATVLADYALTTTTNLIGLAYTQV